MFGSCRIGVAKGRNQASISEHPDSSELGQIDDHRVLSVAYTHLTLPTICSV